MSERKRRIVFDIEANSLTPDVIWCVVAKDIDTNEVFTFTEGTDVAGDQGGGRDGLQLLLLLCGVVIGHNIISYDLPALVRLWGISVPDDCRVMDTLVLSRLLHAKREGGHSLEAWGLRLGFPKGEHTDWSKYSSEMLDYCINDVHLNHKVFLELDAVLKRNPGVFDQAIEVEHQMARICLDMETNGFRYNYEEAQKIEAELVAKVAALDVQIQQAFPPRSQLIKEQTPKTTKYGTISRVGFQWYDSPDLTQFTVGEPFSVFHYVPFNAGSPKQVVERLWEAGWTPKEKTDTHKQAEKERKVTDHHKYYGWKINEVNVATLPETAPEGARLLVERILLAARIRTLTEWKQACQTQVTLKTIEDTIRETKKLLEQKTASVIANRNDMSVIVNTDDTTVSDLTNMKDFLQSRVDAARFVKNEDVNSVLTIAIPQVKLEEYSALGATLITNGTSKIHGTFAHIGTSTHRMSHSKPNVGNIATKKSIKYNTPYLRSLALEYGGRMRSLWGCSDDATLVGCDMEGAHLRIFAHLIDDKEFIKALVEGKKEDGTDIHSLNKRNLGDLCVDRDRSKTFIFSFLNGAAAPKVSEIFGCSLREAKGCLEGYVEAYPGLKHLKQNIIPRDARRGYFVGLDGRKVLCDSEHLMMGMYLQNAEAVIMKHANVLWRQWLDEEGITYAQVNFVHDEFVTEVYGDRSIAERVGLLQSKAITAVGERFGMRCPLAGEYKLGSTWLDVH